MREISSILDMPPSTVYRILVALTKEKFLYKNRESGHYQIGLEFYRMLWNAESHFPIRRIAFPHLQNIVEESNESVFLGLYDSGRMEMIFIASADSKHPLRYAVPLNEWIPVHCGASGLAIMAFLPEEERCQIIEKTNLVPITENTVTEPEVLERKLEKIRIQGYALSHGERIAGAVGIAAPFWNASDQVMGDLVFTIPEQRFNPEEEANLAIQLMQHAQEITEEIQGVLRKAPIGA